MTRNVLGALALALAAALALGACTPAPDDDVPEVTPTFKRTVPAWDFPETVPSIAPDGKRMNCNVEMTFCFEDLPGAMPLRTPFPPDPAMTERLADRRLSREEYEAQFLDYTACLTEFGLGFDVWDMSAPMISHGLHSVGNDWTTEAYRAETFCGDTYWQPVSHHWQAFEMPQPHLEEDVEHLLACMTEAGMTPVITAVPDDGPERALARHDLFEQGDKATSAGEVSQSVWDSCVEGTPSSIAEAAEQKENDS
ncbi:hypothetical protein [Sanguibacter sp. HDW7]|uniref:hypothetical protein n=1 Tax=Sanguibacter sp. HDW7 TaxID=2714931 RepID=UPI00140A5880|nr:hypothetical protein [Sanguibacter sp. HDW7]QIK84517.1 hypothetical protein G7063_13525 [Sanguibacter sp. HDW7]